MTGSGIPAGDGRSSLPARILSVICGILLLAMMGVTIIDVIGRYLFNAPLQGATELTALLLVSTIFIGLPALCRDEENVTVDLLVDHMPKAWHTLRLALIRLLSAVVLGVVSWRLFEYGNALASYQETTVSLRLPVAPFAWLCAACAAIAAIVTFINLFSRFRQ